MVMDLHVEVLAVPTRDNVVSSVVLVDGLKSNMETTLLTSACHRLSIQFFNSVPGKQSGLVTSVTVEKIAHKTMAKATKEQRNTIEHSHGKDLMS